LNKFDPDQKIFTQYIHDPEDEKSLSHDRVLTIHEDKSGVLWIGTYGGGLNCFDREKEVFQNFTEKDGLANDAIYGILGDENDNLWLSTNKGMSKFHIPTKSFKNYDVNDGLQSNEFNGGAFFKTKSGEMYFGGINGYNKFHPEEIEENKYIPPIVLTSFKIFDQEAVLAQSISEIKEIRLSYEQNFFAFEFTSLDYTNPEKNQFAYMLEGIDPDWKFCGSRRYANYTNLDGGSYIFKIKGTNSDGIWNEAGTEVAIQIVPPYWKMWWFRIIAGLLIIGLVYGIYHRRVTSFERQKKKLKGVVNKRTEEINERNQELLNSKKETDNILHNVEEGLFLLNAELSIRTQHSSALEKIFNEEKLANKNFLDILKGKINEKDYNSTKEFLELMFSEDVDEQTLKELNPLSEIELSLDNSESTASHWQYLSFKFKRILDQEGKIIELIVTVNDLTHQIRLARMLEESEAYGKKQMDRLLSILHVEPQLLKEFMDGANLELNDIDEVLEHHEDKVNFNSILEKIYRSMHIIKGNASLLDLKFFVEKAHEFEDKIDQLRKNKTIAGSDFIPLILQLKDMRNTLNELNNLINRIANIRSHFRPKRSYEEQIFIRSLENLINNLSNDLKKKIVFDHQAFEVGIVPYNYRLATREILIQMVRNSIYHGIETPEERKRAHKDETGSIKISTITEDNYFGFKLFDDGRGLQIEELRRKAKSSGQWKDADINQWNNEKVAQVIFATGISTLDKANFIAGRGVGMDIVKEKIENLGGQIQIDFDEGKYCEFVVKLPLKVNDKKKIEESTRIYALTS
jgi:signal transduction histidine kinase